MKSNQRLNVLATDLDGTFIPIGDDRESLLALEQIGGQSRQGDLRLVYVSGRHLEFVFDAIVLDGLPEPDWILCDVGSSAYERVDRSRRQTCEPLTQELLATHFHRCTDYDARLNKISGNTDVESFRQDLARLEGFRLQEPEKQTRHKLSYYVDGKAIEQRHADALAYLEANGLPYGVISSVDPFNGDGLVDVLPKDVSKAFALDWWCESHDYPKHEIVFCGDSGNDYAALIGGYRAVVVGNADRQLAARVQEVHDERGWTDRLFLASKSYTAGVLEGLQWFRRPPNSSSQIRREEPAMDNLIWGAVPTSRNVTDFRLFAPAHDTVTLLLSGPNALREVGMKRDTNGFFTASVNNCPVGSLYQYRLGAQTTALDADDPVTIPDPASRYQPEGVHGRSQVVSRQFDWQHDQVPRVQHASELIVYEMHVGAFTHEGTYLGAIDRLDELVALGVTAIELMPIAQCPGRWNWGYDATFWYAPMNSLGTPEDLRRFVDAAHERGLNVFLDVVYNHLGPEGNYWGMLGNYFSDRHRTPWGAAPNFDDGPESQWIRRFVVDNAIYWLDEFHIDGLRVDAIHCMKDDSQEHITRQLGQQVRQWSERAGRRVWLIAETNVYDASMTASLEDDGCGFDAQWGDDFAHALLACVRSHDRLTVRTYRPHVDLARALHRGFVFRGDVRGDRGREEVNNEALVQRVDTSSVVYCIQNHDFIGNHPLGKRFHQITSPETQASAATLLILSPSIPMLFMGEEFACEHPFAFFVDFGDEDLRHAVVEGRRREYPQHDWSGGVLPTDERAFHSARIGPVEGGNTTMRNWYRDLIRIRKEYLSRGLLTGEKLQPITDTERGVYALKFTCDQASLIVVCRLGETAEGIRPQADAMSRTELAEVLEITGELPPIILDSRLVFVDDRDRDLASGLHANHAIVMATEADQPN